MALFAAHQWQSAVNTAYPFVAGPVTSAAACETAYMASPFSLFPQIMPAALPNLLAASSFPIPAFFPSFMPVTGHLVPAMFYMSREIDASAGWCQQGAKFGSDLPSESSASTGVAVSPCRARGIQMSGEAMRMALYRCSDSASRTSLESCSGAGSAAHCTGSAPTADASSVQLFNPDLNSFSDADADADADAGSQCRGFDGVLQIAATRGAPPSLLGAGATAQSRTAVVCSGLPMHQRLHETSELVSVRGAKAPPPQIQLENPTTARSMVVSKSEVSRDADADGTAVREEGPFGHAGRADDVDGMDDIDIDDEPKDDIIDDICLTDGLYDGEVRSRSSAPEGVVITDRGQRRIMDVDSSGHVLLPGSTGVMTWVDAGRQYRRILRRRHKQAVWNTDLPMRAVCSPCNRKPLRSAPQSHRGATHHPVCRGLPAHGGARGKFRGDGALSWGGGAVEKSEEGGGPWEDAGGSCCGPVVQVSLPERVDWPAGSSPFRGWPVNMPPDGPNVHTVGTVGTAVRVKATPTAIAPMAPSAVAGFVVSSGWASLPVLPPMAVVAATTAARMDCSADRAAWEAELRAVLAEETGFLDPGDDSSASDVADVGAGYVDV